MAIFFFFLLDWGGVSFSQILKEQIVINPNSYCNCKIKGEKCNYPYDIAYNLYLKIEGKEVEHILI